MHQRVPADKCSCGLTRGKIRGLRTPESSQSAMDLLIASLDKECENNDALSAAAARVLGTPGLESACGRGGSGQGQVWKSWFVDSWYFNLISMECCWHQTRGRGPSIRSVYRSPSVEHKGRWNEIENLLQPHKCSIATPRIRRSEYLKCFRALASPSGSAQKGQETYGCVPTKVHFVLVSSSDGHAF